MSLYEGTAAHSSSDPQALADALLLFGAVCDLAVGARLDAGARIAALAVALAAFAGRSEPERDALAFAAHLRNAGALGNPALQKNADLPARAVAMQLSDVPADGARLCERIAALPPLTADLVRWQSEAWDGTGYPDQLRWHGVPNGAQFLRLAAAYVQDGEPEEAFGTILAQSGRLFGPDQTRTFIMWYHTNAGEVGDVPLPVEALDATRTHVSDVLTLLGERIDEHNGTPGRWKRIGDRAERIAAALDLPVQDRNSLALAALFFGIGEVRESDLETTQFDPLSRMGIDVRARNAAQAAAILARFPTFAGIAPLVGARAEWYDGTGKPAGLRRDAIPAPSQVLAVTIAYDSLGDARRLDEAAGTQFDPRVVRAMTEVARTHA